MKRMNIEARPDWHEKAKTDGFGFHTMYDEPYWTDDGYYSFTMKQIERDIEDPTDELQNMCLDAAERIIASEEAMSKLHIPQDMMSLIKASWDNQDKNLYGRFDLAYNGKGPAKLLEYNADTPTSLFEASYFQHNWMIDQVEAGRLPAGTDQFNLMQETLIEAFGYFNLDQIFHFACWKDNLEDAGTVSYMMDCALQAGHKVKMVDIQKIGVDALGRLLDEDDITIEQCFKLYPWEDMLREEFTRYIKPGVFTEPVWKSVISNKGFLAMLWDMNKRHPNLLETHFEGTSLSSEKNGYVIKPFFSREGENVKIVENGEVIEETAGDYGDKPKIIQERAHLFEQGGKHAVLGSWVIGNTPCGLGMREDNGLITKDMSRFVPHVIID